MDEDEEEMEEVSVPETPLLPYRLAEEEVGPEVTKTWSRASSLRKATTSRLI